MIAVLVEGKCEKVIMDILLDNELLYFSREEILYEECIITLSIKQFETDHLSISGINEKIDIIRVLDSKNKGYKISKAFKSSISSCIDYVTAREIEVLIIINEGLYDEYLKVKNKEKPSGFIKKKLRNYEKNKRILCRIF